MSAPTIVITEKDLSQTVPGFPGVYGLMLVPSKFGSEEPTLVSSQTDYLNKFTLDGKVHIGETLTHFSALAFLEKSNKLWVKRVTNGALYGGVLVSSGQDIDGDGSVDSTKGLTSGVSSPTDVSFGNDHVFAVLGSNRGAWNNRLSIKITNYSTNPDLVKLPNAFLLEVLLDGKPVESWVLSRNPEAKDGYGNNIYVESVNGKSRYIQIVDNIAVDSSINPEDITTPVSLSGGDDGNPVTDAQMVQALQEFKDADSYPVTVLMDGGWSTPAYQRELISIAEEREDCVAILSVPIDKQNSVNDIVDYVTKELNNPSSYGAVYVSHVKVLDRFNNREIYVDPTGFVGAVISQTATNQEIWYAPAGWNRGKLNVLDVYKRFTKAEQDYLYDNNVNFIKFKPGMGIAIFGQKTLQRIPSALDRLNVRLLLVALKPAIKRMLESFFFEFNDEETRYRVRTILSSYLEEVKAKRGIYDYYVKCDEENNTPQVIDNNELEVWIFIKPMRVVEYIKVPLTLSSTGVNFGEITIGG